MLNGQYGDTHSVNFLNQIDCILALRGRQSCHGLIQQKQLGVRGHGPGNLQTLLLGHIQLAGIYIFHIQHPAQLQNLVHMLHGLLYVMALAQGAHQNIFVNHHIV